MSTDLAAAADGRAAALVSGDAIAANCRFLRSKLTGGAELCAVVKADGYGHGSVGAARAALAGGASRLAVVSAAEAAELREHLPDADLFVMGALVSEEELKLALEVDAAISVWQPEFLEYAIGTSRLIGTRLRIHVKYDSGMGRLGCRDAAKVGEMADTAAAAGALEGVWTHFATADEPGDHFFGEQLERFVAVAAEVKSRYPQAIAHAANSAGVLRGPASHFDMVRCGIAIYGLDPFQGDAIATGLQPALTLVSRVADVKSLETGDSVGYGRRWQAPGPRRVAVVPVGYGDGVRRLLSDRGSVIVAGEIRPIVGTVSMDNITVDLGERSEVSIGDQVILIGEDPSAGMRITAEDVAGLIGTINYEVTCGISSRVPRVYS